MRELQQLGWLILSALPLFIVGAIWEAFSLRYLIQPRSEGRPYQSGDSPGRGYANGCLLFITAAMTILVPRGYANGGGCM